MTDRPDIRHLTRSGIDTAKWDNCISNADNGLIYAYSFYLDQMADNWDALILGDYEVVMPLPWRSRLSIQYIYQPFLTAQLGVFGNGDMANLAASFINAIPKKFRLVEISLNPANNTGSIPSILRSNYVLNLRQSYQLLYDSYRENIRRNIRKAFQLGSQPGKGFDVEQVISLAVNQMHDRGKEANENIQRFRKLYNELLLHEKAITYGIFSGSGDVLASAVFFFSHDRAYYILVGNHPNGRTIGASHALIDAFIKDHAGRNLLLDFEGSDIRNLAYFYSSFGAVEIKYPWLQINRLPFYLKWLKK